MEEVGPDHWDLKLNLCLRANVPLCASVCKSVQKFARSKTIVQNIVHLVKTMEGWSEKSLSVT